MTRINSVRKEQLRNNYELKGLSAKLVDLDISIRVSSEQMKDGMFLKKKLFMNLKKAIQKHVKNLTMDEIIKFASECSFGQYRVEITPLGHNISKNTGYIRDLLAVCGGVRKTDVDDYCPVEITYKTLKNERTGYSLMKSEFKKKYHGRNWYLKFQQSQTLFDVTTLLAECILYNSLEKFTLANQDYIKYWWVNEIIRSYGDHEKKIVKIPQDERMQEDFKAIIKSYGLVKEYVIVNRENIEWCLKSSFYVDVDEQGFVKNLEPASIQDCLWPELVSQMVYVKEKTDRLYEESTNYARAFETKKHINKSTKERMENNVFLQRFGLCELDNQVDLDKFSQLEQDFSQLIKQVYIPNCQDHSFRIKKLGKHKAAGLYYPGAKATIFDLDYPNALIHEIGHQIDNVLAKDGDFLLSEAMRFRPVIEQYKERVLEKIHSLDKNDPTRKRWEGKSKYNASYYFQNTEIFARSYELYLTHIGIKSSFLKEAYHGVEYPENEMFISLVRDYFDTLFSYYEISKDEENMIVKNPLRPVANNVILHADMAALDGSNCQQLSLFDL